MKLKWLKKLKKITLGVDDSDYPDVCITVERQKLLDLFQSTLEEYSREVEKVMVKEIRELVITDNAIKKALHNLNTHWGIKK